MESKKDKSQRNILKEIEEIKYRRGDQYNYLTHPLANTWQAATYRIEELQKSFVYSRWFGSNFRSIFPRRN
jgi:hypothetical protein